MPKGSKETPNISRKHSPWGLSDLKSHLTDKMSYPQFALTWTEHAKERMKERGINTQNILHLLASEFELSETAQSSRSDEGFFKYTIFCAHSIINKDRKYGAVIIPSLSTPAVKIITVMWEDIQR